MLTTIKAIETVYKGYRFRSRLEARWAVFFDKMDLPWEYEPEGFETGAGRYLPDFKIFPRWSSARDIGETYVEIKHSQTTESDWLKAKALARDYASDSPNVLLLAGPPAYVVRGSRGAPRFDTLCLGYRGLNELAFCLRQEQIGRGELAVAFSDSGYLGCSSDMDFPARWETTVSLDGWYARAVNAARQARFEHGETPL